MVLHFDEENRVKVFEKDSDEEMLKIYKDIVASKELGVSPKTLEKYARTIKQVYPFDMSQAMSFVKERFYEEVAARHFAFIMGYQLALEQKKEKE